MQCCGKSGQRYSSTSPPETGARKYVKGGSRTRVAVSEGKIFIPDPNPLALAYATPSPHTQRPTQYEKEGTYFDQNLVSLSYFATPTSPTLVKHCTTTSQLSLFPHSQNIVLLLRNSHYSYTHETSWTSRSSSQNGLDVIRCRTVLKRTQTESTWVLGVAVFVAFASSL